MMKFLIAVMKMLMQLLQSGKGGEPMKPEQLASFIDQFIKEMQPKKDGPKKSGEKEKEEGFIDRIMRMFMSGVKTAAKATSTPISAERMREIEGVIRTAARESALESELRLALPDAREKSISTMAVHMPKALRHGSDVAKALEGDSAFSTVAFQAPTLGSASMRSKRSDSPASSMRSRQGIDSSMPPRQGDALGEPVTNTDESAPGKTLPRKRK